MFLAEIPRRLRKCALCEASFSPGTSYISRLKLIKENLYERSDFCSSCCDNEVEVAGSISWKGEVPKKSSRDKAEDKVEGWIQSLREMMEKETESDKKEALLTALFLKRKKVLIERGEIEKSFLFEVKETEEMFILPKVSLHNIDPELKERLAQKL